MADVIDLPVLVGGRRISAPARAVEFQYPGGTTIRLPEPSDQDISRMLATPRRLLSQLHLEEILLFFNEVSKAWMNPANPWRQLALAYAPLVTGYPRDTIERDLNFVGGSMARGSLFDLIETDIGPPEALDGWLRNKSVHHRAWPKGLATHVMVGNVPLAGFFTIVRSLATKNITVAKTSSRDVVSPQCLVQCMHDVDPTHPVVQATSAFYWKAEGPVEDAILAASDVVTVWGRAPSIRSVKQRAPPATDVVDFGPKRSLAVVFADRLDDLDATAMWMAFDACNYNQEACFSTQEIFCLGDVDRFSDALAHWLARLAEHSRPTFRVLDADAHVQRIRMEAIASGWSVTAAPDSSWTIIRTDGPCQVDEHPLGRTLFIHPCTGIEQILPLIDSQVQGVTVAPFDQAWELADGLAGRGADRIIPPGRSGRMREGFIHDGFHPMRRMVRWSTVDVPEAGSARFQNRHSQESTANYRAWITGERPYDAIAGLGAYRSFEARQRSGHIMYATLNGTRGNLPDDSDDSWDLRR